MAPAPASPPKEHPPAFFGNVAYDQAVAGMGAGIVATVAMNPLDLIKVKFQVDTSPVRPLFRSTPLAASGSASIPTSASASASASPPAAMSARIRSGAAHVLTGGRIGRDMGRSLRTIVREQGASGLYRGLATNIVGNSVSWGLYFLWYTQMKALLAHGDERIQLTPSQHMLAASVSGCCSAFLTNPIWVVKVRMYANAPPARGSGSRAGAAPCRGVPVYTGLLDGLRSIYRTEGIRGWYRGAGLSLLGVSNAAVQFTTYEALKRWRSAVHVRRAGGNPEAMSETGVKLSNAEYILTSGASKLTAIFITYPYQVVRSRVQNVSLDNQFSSALTTVRATWSREGGIRAFYKGLTATCIRVLPATCITFVTYEQIAWFLRDVAARQAAATDVRPHAHTLPADTTQTS